DEHGCVAALQQRTVDGYPPGDGGLDRGERLAQRRERSLAVGEHLRVHSGFLPAKPSSTPCQNWMSSSPSFQHRSTASPSRRDGKSSSPSSSDLICAPAALISSAHAPIASASS